MEDMLAELLRRNFAILDIERGEIRPISKPVPRFDYIISERVIQVWQDVVTGAFLPLSKVERWRKPPSEIQIQQRLMTPDPDRGWQRDFVDAPDKRIINELQSIDPRLFIAWDLPGEPSEWHIDSLVNKDRDGAFPIYLEIEETLVERAGTVDRIRFIHEPLLPHWLTRTWSIRLRTASTSPEATNRARVEIALEQGNCSAEESTATFERLMLNNSLARWLAAFRRRIAHTPTFPVNPSEINRQIAEQAYKTICDEEGNSRSDLLQHVDRVSHHNIELYRPENQINHIVDLWRQTKSYLFILADDLREEALEHILKVTIRKEQGSEDNTPWLILLKTGSKNIQGKQDIAPQSSQLKSQNRAIYYRLCMNLQPQICIRDGEELRLGNVQSLLCFCPLLRLQDRMLILELINGLSQYIGESDDAFYLYDKLKSLTEAIEAETSTSTLEDSPIKRSLVSIRSTSRKLEERFGFLTNIYCSDFENELKKLTEKRRSSQKQQSDELDTSIRRSPELIPLTDRNLLMVETAQAQKAQGAKLEAKNDGGGDNNLEQLESQIRSEVQSSVLPFAALVTDLSGEDSLDSVIAALRYVSRSAKQHDLRFIVDHIPWFLKAPQFDVIQKTFEDVIGKGTRIRFVLCPKFPNIPLENEITTHFGELKRTLGSRGTEVLAGLEPAPNAMLLDVENRDIVIIDTFMSTHESILRLAVDSIPLSRQLNDLIGHARKL